MRENPASRPEGRPAGLPGVRIGRAELAVVAAVIAFCAVFLLRNGHQALERAAAVEWFAQFTHVRQQLVEHFALTGEWTAPEVRALDGRRTRCQAQGERIACELRSEAGETTAALSWRPASTVGALNWTCGPGDAPGATDGSQWFVVCAQPIHSKLQ